LVTKSSFVGGTILENINLSKHLDTVKKNNVKSCENESPVLPPISKKTTETINYVIQLMQRTLLNGGSIFIPVDIGLDTLILLMILQPSFKTFFKAYPIFFLSPTG
jgi:hypothetical protein